MLFTFNYFWKFLICLVGTWIFYGFFGYEVTMVTLMSMLVAFKLKSTNHVI